MKPMTVVCVALFAGTAAFGQSKSAAVEQAEKDHAAAVAKAREEYNAVVAKSHDTFKKRLAEVLAEETKAGKVNTDLLDTIKRLETDGPPVLAAEDLNAKDKAQTRWVGVWTIRYGPDNTRVYAIKNNGEVEFAKEKKSGKLDPKKYTINFGDGKLERLTFIGDKVFVEHFSNMNDLDRKHPDTIGLGTRKR